MLLALLLCMFLRSQPTSPMVSYDKPDLYYFSPASYFKVVHRTSLLLFSTQWVLLLLAPLNVCFENITHCLVHFSLFLTIFFKLIS